MIITLKTDIINVHDEIFLTIRKYKQEKNENESGGILFGMKEKDGNVYHIIDLTIPNKKDKSSRFSFIRNAKAAQKKIKKKWKDSDGYINYIGEWHTHPEAKPSPSYVDINNYEQISKDGSSLYPISINIIFGNANMFYICGYQNGKIVFEGKIDYE